MCNLRRVKTETRSDFSGLRDEKSITAHPCPEGFTACSVVVVVVGGGGGGVGGVGVGVFTLHDTFTTAAAAAVVLTPSSSPILHSASP